MKPAHFLSENKNLLDGQAETEDIPIAESNDSERDPKSILTAEALCYKPKR
jgi:hypothetical protein